jgi:hypothetical protein
MLLLVLLTFPSASNVRFTYFVCRVECDDEGQRANRWNPLWVSTVYISTDAAVG